MKITKSKLKSAFMRWEKAWNSRTKIMPCALGRDLQLAQMDAPDLLPAGSMTATEYADGPRLLMESNIRRGADACITASNLEHAA